MQKYHFWIVVLLAMAAIAAALVPTFRTGQQPVPAPTRVGGFGTVEEAFAVASRTVMEYLAAQEADSFLIDPVFSSMLLSKSKTWTIKGHAFSPDNNKKAYHWLVILNFDDMGEWQILAKTITLQTRQVEPW
jgi:hypothetical protein